MHDVAAVRGYKSVRVVDRIECRGVLVQFKEHMNISESLRSQQGQAIVSTEAERTRAI